MSVALQCMVKLWSWRWSEFIVGLVAMEPGWTRGLEGLGFVLGFFLFGLLSVILYSFLCVPPGWVLVCGGLKVLVRCVGIWECGVPCVLM